MPVLSSGCHLCFWPHGYMGKERRAFSMHATLPKSPRVHQPRSSLNSSLLGFMGAALTNHDWLGTSLVVQWLRICLSVQGDMGSIPGRETKIQHAAAQLSPRAATTEPACSRACAPQLERSPHAATKSPRAATKDPTCHNKDPSCHDWDVTQPNK